MVKNLVHGFLHSGVALARLAPRCDVAGSGRRSCAVDVETGTVGTFDLPGGAQVQIDPRVAERPFAAIANGDHLVDVDGFERRHGPPGMNSGRIKVPG